MAEIIPNTKEELKAVRGELQYVFNNEILDENIKLYIFGPKGYNDDTLRETNAYPRYFNNVLSLAFYYVYACYRCDMDRGYGDMDNLTSHNAKRIKNSLENALVRYPITTDLIQFVLTDIQFELAQGGKLKEVFSHLCANSTDGFNFNPYFSIIAEYNKNPARFQYSKLGLMTLFLDLVNNLSFLKEYQLIQNSPDSFQFITKRMSNKLAMGLRPGKNEKYEDMYLDHLLFRDDTKYFGGIYRLFSLETGETKSRGMTMNLRYFTPGDDRSLLFSLPEASEKEDSHLEDQRVGDVYQEILGTDLKQDKEQRIAKKNSNSIDQVHAVNYKYIKNLALAISDAISANEGTKEMLYKRFHNAYPYIFEKRGGETESGIYNDLDWDSVVIMLLIESSPTVVLEHIIRKNQQMFYDIAHNLHKRIYDTENLAVFGQDQISLRKIVHDLIDAKFILGEAGGFGKLPTEKTYEKLFPRAAAMLILSKLNDWQETDSEDSLIYTGNLRNNISLLERASKEFDVEKRLRYACIILGETIKHTISFYAGLFAYGKAKAVFDGETKGKTLNKMELLKHQRKLEDIFLDAAKRQAEALPTGSAVEPRAALELVDIFVEFCKKCTLLDNSTISETSKNLHAAVGKYEIIDLRKFEKLVNRLKNPSGTSERETANEWLAITLEILEYFETGSLRDASMDEDLFNAVYPFTAVFNRRKENQDGYKTVNFSLNIDTDDETPDIQPLEINVLSEFAYDRSEVYYCVPNVLRSNYKWWIDPILISFREFNDIFFDIRKDDESCRQHGI